MPPEHTPDDLRALWRPLPRWTRRTLTALAVLAALPLVVSAAFVPDGIGAFLLVVPLMGYMVFKTWRDERPVRKRPAASTGVTARPPR